ncbi:MAG: hypothetical protein J7L89_01050 [Bacteroidales bacterium]|nr:hypothetical protein [Bacteroidales bacterium]
MKGKELLINTIRGEETSRTPWVPFVGVHGGYLIGTTADLYLQSSELMIQGLSKAVELYQPDGLPVCFDLQIEAEALGCRLNWSPDNPPAVVTHPLAEGVALKTLKIPGPKDGRIPMVMETAREMRKKFPELGLYGLVTGPFTLALHLLGTDIFMKMFEDPEGIRELLTFTAEVTSTMAGYYLDAGCDIIAMVDPMTSQIGPEQFKEFIHEPASSVFNFIRKSGALSSFFVCGHAQQNIEVMSQTGPDNVSIDENIPLDFVREVCKKYDISFGGNLQLTMVLLMGSEEDCMQHAWECITTADSPRFILAPGCDLPMKTPPENIRAITRLVNDPYQQEVIQALGKTSSKPELLNLDDYGNIDKVIVDIITLDSESCAPCQYMVEAVKQVAPHFEGIVEWREHSIKDFEGITFMSSLFVKNIPTICIDGKITFVSKIPPKNELIRAIQKRINEKLKSRLRIKPGEILLAGESGEELTELKRKTELALAELGTKLDVRIETGEEFRQNLGVADTPAWISVKYRIRSEGRQPTIEVIKEWIKDLL